MPIPVPDHFLPWLMAPIEITTCIFPASHSALRFLVDVACHILFSGFVSNPRGSITDTIAEIPKLIFLYMRLAQRLRERRGGLSLAVFMLLLDASHSPKTFSLLATLCVHYICAL